jgi:site-specific DNA-methyltransferase (adenine-specific)
VYKADALRFLRWLPDQSVDMILTDMPYGTTACSWDTVIDLDAWWAEAHRVAKPRAAIVCTGSQPFTSRLVMSNVKRFRYEWVWDKVKISNFANAKKQPLRKHENVLVFSAGAIKYYPILTPGSVSKPFGRIVASSSVHGNFSENRQVGVGYPQSIIRHMLPNNLTGGGLHPTQKPVALFEYLIRTYTRPGDLVVDPFVGSGTTALAARNTGRRFLCCDLLLEYVQIARRRLAQPYTPDMFETLLPKAEPAQQMTLDL